MSSPLNRRSFLQTLGAGAGTLMLPGALRAASSPAEIPSYLKGYEKPFAENPRAAALQWFCEARFGLFMHYGLYSLDGKHKTPEQVMIMLAKARGFPANLLLNTGPLPDGAIHGEDVKTLREVGRRLRGQAWPAPDSSPPPEKPPAR